MSGGGPGAGRTRISVNIAEAWFGRLDQEASRIGARLGLPRLTLSHCVRAAIGQFLAQSDGERTAAVARWGGDGTGAGPEPPSDRS